MTFSIVVLTLLTAVGAATDYSMKLASQSSSQNLADSVALKAAVFVRLNNKIPEAGSPEHVAPGDHKASDFGYVYQGWVDGGSDNVNVNIAYDEVAREATVIVTGNTVSTFSQIMGQDKLPFESKSVVNFAGVALKDVASVIFVLDNSGSMAWNDKPYLNGGLTPPTQTTSRISALKTSVNDLMDYLSPIVGDQATDDEKVFRSGMLAYNSAAISSRTRTMAWRTLSSVDVGAMGAEGGTNPTQSMTTAANWMIAEPSFHESINGKDPLRFVVLMTDGVNDNIGGQWVSASNTGEWRRKVCTGFLFLQSCSYEYRTSVSKPYGNAGSTLLNISSSTEWTEGRWTRPDDEATLVQCQRLKDDGVTVFTIGFSLESGKYDMNYQVYDPNAYSYYTTYTINPETTQNAYDFLAECASDETKFLTPNTADELNDAFKTIGRSIVAETIRIKS